MEVLAYDLKPNPKVQALGIPYVSVEEILACSDVISVHVPLLPSTHHFIDVRWLVGTGTLLCVCSCVRVRASVCVCLCVGGVVFGLEFDRTAA